MDGVDRCDEVLGRGVLEQETGRTGFDRASGTISVPARTVAVLVQRQAA